MRVKQRALPGLAIWMVGFGLCIGIVFPFFVMMLGVSPDVALKPAFFAACLGAGTLVGIINYGLMARDHTERLRSEKALQRYRLLAESAGDTVFFLRADGTFVDVNRAAELAYGYTRDELMAMNVAELRHPDYMAPLRAQLDKALEDGIRFETRHVRKDGTWLDVEVDSQSTDIGGEQLAVSVCRDITERKRAEAALRQSEERYRSILNASPDDITITDLEGRILVVSPAALTMFGCNREDELLGHLLADSIVPEDRGRTASTIALVLQGTTPGPTEYRGLRPDGSTFDIEVNAEPMRDAEGQPTNLVFVVRDITERKHAEKGRFEDLEEVANVDRLTGLHNRRGFDLVGEQAIAQAQRANQGIGLIFCDMDDLKTINDEFGHSQGDRALVDAASILRLTLRSADAMARIGGDEFVVLAIGDGSESLVHLNERLQQGFEFFNKTDKRPYRLSMSSGTAWCQPGTPCRLEELRSAADSNMYAEKVRRSRSR